MKKMEYLREGTMYTAAHTKSRRLDGKKTSRTQVLCYSVFNRVSDDYIDDRHIKLKWTEALRQRSKGNLQIVSQKSWEKRIEFGTLLQWAVQGTEMIRLKFEKINLAAKKI